MFPTHRSVPADWPEIDYPSNADTAQTLQLYTQIAGKIRLSQSPWTNHSWHVPLYVSTRGLMTTPIPYGGRYFELEFDFHEQALIVRCATGRIGSVPLGPGSVADFYASVMAALSDLGYEVTIHTTPSEIADAVPFDEDTDERAYDADYAKRLWQALVQIDRVFKEFRGRFIGKSSPVHFFWGSFDLAVTRFSGRDAPVHPGGVPNFPDWVAREAYSHEVSSAGFWPGGGGVDEAAFYSYAYPAPGGFANAKVEPDEAYWFKDLGEFVLPYAAVRASDSPDETLLAFLESTYVAAADGANWPRETLERDVRAYRDAHR